MRIDMSETGREMVFEVCINREDVMRLGDEAEGVKIIDSIFAPLTGDATFDQQWAAVCAFVAVLRGAA